MEIINSLLFIFNILEIPKEFYPPKFLFDVHNGFSMFYSQNVNSQKYLEWMAKKLENEELLPKTVQKIGLIQGEWVTSMPTFIGLNCESIQQNELDGFELNSTIFCPFNETMNLSIDECVSKIECSDNFYRKTEIICHENIGKNANSLVKNEPTKCENVKIDWIQLRNSKGGNNGSNLSRFELTKGRFYCPSDVSCLKEIIFDGFNNKFTKLIINSIIFIFLLFVTSEINKILK